MHKNYANPISNMYNTVHNLNSTDPFETCIRCVSMFTNIWNILYSEEICYSIDLKAHPYKAFATRSMNITQQTDHSCHFYISASFIEYSFPRIASSLRIMIYNAQVTMFG